MKLYKTMRGAVIEDDGIHQLLTDDWDELINRDELLSYLQQVIASKSVESGGDFLDSDLLAPLGKQEVWAAGVTYFRSRTARMEEAQTAGGADFYDRIYNAERPELSLKLRLTAWPTQTGKFAYGKTLGGTCRSRSSRW
ncbi:MAG: hypothetical protein WKF84_22555 [Pyrinomonadaceae bacterium]